MRGHGNKVPSSAPPECGFRGLQQGETPGNPGGCLPPPKVGLEISLLFFWGWENRPELESALQAPPGYRLVGQGLFHFQTPTPLQGLVWMGVGERRERERKAPAAWVSGFHTHLYPEPYLAKASSPLPGQGRRKGYPLSWAIGKDECFGFGSQSPQGVAPLQG